MTSKSRTPTLHPIRTQENATAIIIAIPGPLSNRVLEWGPWLQSLPKDSASQTAILAFDWTSLQSGSFDTWQLLLDLGEELVAALVTLQASFEGQLPPLIFIAHSLGGIIVKQAYFSIAQQLNHVRGLRDAIAGIVFLGTPHGRSAIDQVWVRTRPLLQQRKSRLSSKGADSDHSAVSQLSVLFEDAAAALPILSINETQEAILGGSRTIPFRSKKSLLVGRAAGATNARRERLLDAHTDHFGLCTVDLNSPVYENINDFCENVMLECSQWIQAQKTTTDFASASVAAASSSSSSRRASHKRYSSQSRLSAPSLSPTTRSRTLASALAGSTLAMNASNPKYLTLEKEDPLLPCHVIPYERNPEFFGRQEVLKAIEDHLLPAASNSDGRASSPGLRTYAICGPGGMGKTQTATEFALAHVDDFAAIFWMRADSYANLAADFSAAAIELGLINDDSLDAKDLAVTRELVKGWLRRPVRSYTKSAEIVTNNAAWLLVFDNLDSRDTVADFWPVDGSCGAVLITSRDPLMRTTVWGVAHGIDLLPFSHAESSTLLLRLTQREGDDEEHEAAAAVCKVLDGFPLALTQMAGVISRQELSFDEFLERYREEHAHKALFELHFETRPGSVSYKHTLATVFSLDTLEKSGLALLEVISLMNSGVSERIFESVLGQERLRDFPRTMTQYQDARTELTKSSLISRNRKDKTLFVSRIVQDAACARMHSYRFIATFQFALRLITRAWPRAGNDAIRQDNSRWKECEKLRPHALRLKDRFSKQSPLVQSTLALSVSFASLLIEVGWYLQERGQTQLAIECFTTARDNLMQIIAQKSVSQSSRLAPTAEKQEPMFDKVGDIDISLALEDDEGDAHLLLGETYRSLGFAASDTCDVETAYEVYLEYNRLMVEQLGCQEKTSDPRLAISFLELAVAHGFRLDYENSKFCSEKALELCQWIPSDEGLGIAASGMVIQTLAVANLSLALLELGDPTKARDIALKALADREKKVGVDDRTSFVTGRILHALGNILHVLEQDAESFKYHRRAMLHYKETVGPNHHRTGDMCFKVAQHHLLQNENDEARDFMNQSLAIYRDQAFYRAERARVLHWKAKISPDEEAARLEADAQRLLKETWKERKFEDSTFEDSDYDRMVVFWSR